MKEGTSNYTETELEMILANTAEDFSHLGIPFVFTYYKEGDAEPVFLSNGMPTDKMGLFEYMLEQMNNDSLEKDKTIAELELKLSAYKNVN